MQRQKAEQLARMQEQVNAKQLELESGLAAQQEWLRNQANHMNSVSSEVLFRDLSIPVLIRHNLSGHKRSGLNFWKSFASYGLSE